MRADHLEVWQSGFVSPLILVEVMLVAYIIQAWSLNCPLSISKTIAIMNSFTVGTVFEELVIAWKTKRGILNPNADVSLVGWKWWLMFAATKNASMDESVLMQAFKMMDDLGITERGIDEDGNPYFPYIILDGHISRIGELFLRYVNDPSTRWGTGLGAPLATECYQFHDDTRQNGALKTSLTHGKSEFFLKKRIHGLPAEMLPVEIVIVARGAILKSFVNSACAEAALAHRGFRPFNRNPLDVPAILRTAPEETQRERATVLRSRGIDDPLAAPLPPTQRDLLTTGSGLLAGGAAAANQLHQAAATLNYSGYTVSGIMTLTQDAKSKNDGRRANMGADASMQQRLPPDVLKRRYEEAKRMTAGVVFGCRTVISSLASVPRSLVVAHAKSEDWTSFAFRFEIYACPLIGQP